MHLLDVLTRQVSWPGDLDVYFALQCAFYTFYVDVQYLLIYKAYNHQTLLSASPQCTDSAGTLTRWPWPIFRAPLTVTHFTSTFHMSSTIRPITIKPCIVLFLDVLTRQVPEPGDLDLYFALHVDVRYLLKYKTYNNQTLHSASPQCTDSAGFLTRWPWPIYSAAVTLTHYTLTFDFASTIRLTITKPCIEHLFNVRTLQVPWCGDLDLYS